jgi:uncharacterized protein
MIPAAVALVGFTSLFGYLAHLYLRQDRLIFRPGRPLHRSPADYGIAFESVPLVLRGGGESHAWWLPRPSAERVVIFFHGSEGSIAHELPALRFLHSLRANVLAVEYPGYGRAGPRPTEAGCYQAADAAWRFVVETKGFEPGRIVLFGQSLGSAVASELAGRHRCGGLVVQSGFTSIPDLAVHVFSPLPVRPFVRTQMNTGGRIGSSGCPVLILHSAEDEHIPVDHAYRLHAAAPGPKKLIVYDGAHGGVRWLMIPEIRRAWTQLLCGDLVSWEA